MIEQRDAQLVARNAEIEARDAALQVKQAEAVHLRTWIEKLKLEIARLRRMQFGRSSEKLGEQIEQLELIVEDLEASQAQLPRAAAPPGQQGASQAGAQAASRALAARGCRTHARG